MNNYQLIYKYAKQLHDEGELEYRILSNVAIKLHNFLNSLLSQEKESTTNDYSEFNITPELISRLKQSFQGYFTQQFWEEQAEWIIERIEKWDNKDLYLNGDEKIKFPDSVNIKDKKTLENFIKNSCAFYKSEELIQQINLAEISQEEVAEILGLISKPTPITEPGLYLNKSTTPIPSSAIFASGIQAQLRKDLWTDSEGLAVFKQQCKSKSSNYIEHYISSPGDIELLPWEAAEQIIDKFGFISAKMYLIYAAHTMNQVIPWESQFTLKGTNLIRELGWDKRSDISQFQKLNEIAKAAFALSCLVSRAVWIEGRSTNKIDVSCPTGRMWESVVDPRGTADIFSKKVEKPYEIFITIRPGLWTKNFLNRAGAKAREALYQFSYLAQQVLKINPYHDELALRLAIYITVNSRMHLTGEYRVQTLLETALPKTVINKARLNSDKGRKIFNRWNHALKLFINLGWKVSFDKTYPEAIRPNSNTRKPPGYLNKLLEAKIIIQLPESASELIKSKATTKPKLPKISKTYLTGVQVRVARKAKGWNQRQLAAFLGVSQNFISLIEKGERPISSKVAVKLSELLNLQN
ncbi:MAG: helix-turn-helix transcriptional regulator [Waterburya sp.]